jgi:hypothetical protein
MTAFKRAEDVLDYLSDLFTTNKDALGLQFIGYGTQNLIPGYPAIDITSAATVREIHTTQYFLVRFEFNIWVYHANLQVGHAIRTKEDLEIVTKIVNLLHADLTQGDRAIFSFVHDEDPGLTTKQSGTIVTTRLGWTAESRIRFSES